VFPLQASEILTQLDTVMSDSAKDAEAVKKREQLALTSMEKFRVYSRELLDKGRPCDITQQGSALHNRATELLTNDVTAVRYRPPHVTFAPADVTQVERMNLIGKLTVTSATDPGYSR